jgi:ribonuclease P protein component
VSAVPTSPARRQPGRLLKRADFEAVYQQGRRHFSSLMTLFALRRESGPGLRVGLTVPRALGGAVDRNRIKRRMRAAVAANRAALEGPIDVVINPKKSVLTAGYQDILREVERLFAAARRQNKKYKK